MFHKIRIWLSLIFIVSLLATSAYAFDPSAVVGVWTFDDGDATDSSGNGHDGEVVGATAVDGNMGMGLEFDGSDNSFVAVPDLGEFDAVTIAAWVNMTGKVGGWRVLFNVDGWSEGWVHHQIHPNNTVEFSIHSNPGGNDQFGTVVFDESQLNVWHHLATVYSSADAKIWFYVDGQLDAEADWGGNPAVLGAGQIGGWDGGGRGWEGTIDEFIILNVAADVAEVGSLMENGAASVDPADKLATTWAGIKTSQ